MLKQDRQVGDNWQPFPDLEWIRGGISRKSDGPMSWGGSDAQTVADNRRNYIKKLGLDSSRVVTAEQVHSAEIRHVREEEAGRGVFELDGRIPATDGLLTEIPGLVLTTLHADCAPIFYVDPKRKAIGLAHAGWKGIFAGLPGKMLAEMEREFGSNPGDILVVVGPMICTQHYEVSGDRAALFRERFGERIANAPAPLSPPVRRARSRQRRTSGGRIQLDLFAAIRVNLLENGLDPARLPSRPSCTFEDPDFASYRRDGPPARSMLARLQIVGNS